MKPWHSKTVLNTPPPPPPSPHTHTSCYLSCVIWTPLKLVPPEQIFLKYFDHSEKFVPTVYQPHQGKPVHINSHEVTNNDIISGAYMYSSIWLTGFSSVYLGWPLQRSQK